MVHKRNLMTRQEKDFEEWVARLEEGLGRKLTKEEREKEWRLMV